MMIIELRDIWHQYSGMPTWVLENVSIELESGKIILISGHNGSGKTTLLKIAALIYRPLRGEVMVDGRSFWEMNDAEKIVVRRRITYVHEKPMMIRGSVLENIMYPLKLRGFSLSNVIEKARIIMDELELIELANKSAKELSAGQSQLIAIARALAMEPELIFLDEPFAYLDSRRSKLVAEALQRRRKSGIGIVIASHGREEILGGLEPDEVIVLEIGRIKQRISHHKGPGERD